MAGVSAPYSGAVGFKIPLLQKCSVVSISCAGYLALRLVALFWIDVYGARQCLGASGFL